LQGAGLGKDPEKETGLPIPQSLAQLRLPLIGAPLFIVSNPELVIAQCRAGILGSFPALNARESGELARWLEQIQQALAEPQPAGCPYPVAPFAVNQIVHPSNPRLAEDIELAVRYRVPIMITSLHAPTPVVQAAKTYGGLVFHDVISLRHAEKAIEAGVDGLILVTAGAGGHAGPLNPFAFIEEVRKIYSGTIILSGAMSRGHHILAAQAMGADLAYMGTRFVASAEARAVPEYKQMVVESGAEDIVSSSSFTGVLGNYLRGSIVRAGLNPDELIQSDKSKVDFASLRKNAGQKAWKDIWGAGQSVAGITAVMPAGQIVDQLEQEYRSARQRLGR
jgi:nitronate monooxygenase